MCDMLVTMSTHDTTAVRLTNNIIGLPLPGLEATLITWLAVTYYSVSTDERVISECLEQDPCDVVYQSRQVASGTSCDNIAHFNLPHIFDVDSEI